MKTRKILLLTFALTLTCVSAQAQNTPEAIIGQCPSLPSVAHLAEGSDNQAIEAFHAKISTLRESGNKAAERASDAAGAAALNDANRAVQQAYGHSVDEFANMSDAQLQAFAQQQVASRTAAAGLGNMSLAQLQALEGKSDDEIMATMLGSGANNTGLTAAEIQAMAGMTEKQQEAYMKQGDRMQRVQAAAGSQQAVNARAQAQTQYNNAQGQSQISTEIKKITDRWQEIDRINQKETIEVAQKIAEIQAKYEPQMTAIAAKYFDGKVDATPAEIKAAGKRFEQLQMASATESYTLWRNQVGKMRGRIKTKLADVARYDELQAQSLNASGATATAKVMPSIGFDIAGQYLDITSSVTTLP